MKIIKFFKSSFFQFQVSIIFFILINSYGCGYSMPYRPKGLLTQVDLEPMLSGSVFSVLFLFSILCLIYFYCKNRKNNLNLLKNEPTYKILRFISSSIQNFLIFLALFMNCIWPGVAFDHLNPHDLAVVVFIVQICCYGLYQIIHFLKFRFLFKPGDIPTAN